MKKVQIIPSDLSSDSSVKISGSKSESNRVLILNSIFKSLSKLYRDLGDFGSA